MITAVTTVNWSAFPLTMRAQHLSEVYGYTLRTIRDMAAARNPKIPTPCTARPFGWNRADVIRHYERRTA